MDTTISSDRSKVLQLYKNADAPTKQIIEKLFPADQLQESPEDRINSLEDACAINGTPIQDAIPFPEPKTKKQKCINAFAAMIEIKQAFNGGKKRDWKNTNQNKYIAWWRLNDTSSASGVSLHAVDCDDSFAIAAPRLYTLDRDHEELIAERFFNYAEDLMSED